MNGVNDTSVHLHGPWRHQHHHHGPHRHVSLPFRSTISHSQTPDDDSHRHHDSGHDHVHGRIDPTILRSHAGVRAVAISFAVLGVTAALQAVVFSMSGSVALLADLIHNGGDALTAIPLAFAFWVRSNRMERWAGYFVVGTIFISAAIAGIESVRRFIHPEHLTHLPALATAGVIGFAGNEIAALIRLRAGQRLASPALVADGHHARIDGFVSLGVLLTAAALALGIPRADPVVGLIITAVILRVTMQAWRTVRLG